MKKQKFDIKFLNIDNVYNDLSKFEAIVYERILKKLKNLNSIFSVSTYFMVFEETKIPIYYDSVSGDIVKSSSYQTKEPFFLNKKTMEDEYYLDSTTNSVCDKINSHLISAAYNKTDDYFEKVNNKDIKSVLYASIEKIGDNIPGYNKGIILAGDNVYPYIKYEKFLNKEKIFSYTALHSTFIGKNSILVARKTFPSTCGIHIIPREVKITKSQYSEHSYVGEFSYSWEFNDTKGKEFFTAIYV